MYDAEKQKLFFEKEFLLAWCNKTLLSIHKFDLLTKIHLAKKLAEVCENIKVINVELGDYQPQFETRESVGEIPKNLNREVDSYLKKADEIETKIINRYRRSEERKKLVEDFNNKYLSNKGLTVSFEGWSARIVLSNSFGKEVASNMKDRDTKFILQKTLLVLSHLYEILTTGIKKNNELTNHPPEEGKHLETVFLPFEKMLWHSKYGRFKGTVLISIPRANIIRAYTAMANRYVRLDSVQDSIFGYFIGIEIE